MSLECTTLAGHRGVRELLFITQGFALSNGWVWSKMALSWLWEGYCLGSKLLKVLWYICMFPYIGEVRNWPNQVMSVALARGTVPGSDERMLDLLLYLAKALFFKIDGIQIKWNVIKFFQIKWNVIKVFQIWWNFIKFI